MDRTCKHDGAKHWMRLGSRASVPPRLHQTSCGKAGGRCAFQGGVEVTENGCGFLTSDVAASCIGE